MSKIIWSQVLTPSENESSKVWSSPFYPSVKIPDMREISTETNSLVELPDRRAYRSMSRAAVMLSAVCLPALERIKEMIGQHSSFSVGLYCAVEQGPTDMACCQAMLETPATDFAETYKKLRTPKQYLRQLPNLAPAQLGIFLGIMGPLNVYIHSEKACFHALDQAEFDLSQGIVNMALVCSAFSFEDPLLVFRTRKDNPNGTLNEGAAGLLLIADGQKTDWTSWDQDVGQMNYGIATPLVRGLQRR